MGAINVCDTKNHFQMVKFDSLLLPIRVHFKKSIND